MEGDIFAVMQALQLVTHVLKQQPKTIKMVNWPDKSTASYDRIDILYQKYLYGKISGLS